MVEKGLKMGGGKDCLLIALGGGALIVVKRLNDYAKSETSTAFDSVRLQMMDLAQLWK